MVTNASNCNNIGCLAIFGEVLTDWGRLKEMEAQGGTMLHLHGLRALDT